MPSPDLAAVESGVVEGWTRSGLAGRLAAVRAEGTAWPLAAPPFAAYGLPGVREAGQRTITDVYARFKVMRGCQVPPRTGVACHGLGVEIAVANELGLNDPRAIEAYGTSAFAARCRESASRHGSAWLELADRLGWLGHPAPAIRTMDADYIELAWQSLARLFDEGLLTRDEGTRRYCPSCQEYLAEHESRRPGVFRAVSGKALVARLRLEQLPDGANGFLRDADLLAWTAAPWILAACRAVIAEPEETYAIARRSGGDERVVVAESRLYRVLGAGWHVVARVPGRELAGAAYRLPFPHGEVSTGRVVTAQAARGGPADLTEPGVIGPDGRFSAAVPRLHGIFFADAGRVIAAYLSDRGLLFSSAPAEVRRPHCWRCGSPLLNRATSSWYLNVGAGVAWALSRTRYWGTPMPFWRCEDGHFTCVRSLAELPELADPHYPDVAGLRVKCTHCGGDAHWIPETLDASFETGLMPFSQFRDFRVLLGAVAAEDSRDWHEVTAAVGRLLYGREAERAPASAGQVADASGRQMSRRLGNLADPAPLIERHGADVFRWFFASLTPRQTRVAVAEHELEVIGRRVLSRFVSLASASAAAPAFDRRVSGELPALVRDVTAALESFRCDVAVRRLAGFIKVLAGLPAPGPPADCLEVLTRLMAPFSPFLADYVWSQIRPAGAPDSVHLAPWPEVGT